MKKVLIVDDASFLRLTIRTMLEKNGFIIAGEAENGMQGIMQYKKLQPDIVTMDITMPDMTGIDTLKAIKVIDPKAKVIMITAMGQEDMVREAIMYGAVSFIVKPFTEAVLIKTLSKM